MTVEIPTGAIVAFDARALPRGWKHALLGDLCTVRRGSSPRPIGDPRFFDGGTIPWIKIGDATRTGGRYLDDTAEHVNEVGAERSVRVPPGSLIVANSGVSLGFAVITRVEGCIHDGWLLLTQYRGIDRDYLYYVINHFTARLRQLADGSTQPNLNTDIARRLLLPLPPLSEQQRIAELLTALDDKIEQNRRTGRALEGLARAVFKAWFVDFEPVKAKAAGAAAFPGMSATAFAALPDRCVDSELGPVPDGWAVKPLSESVRLTMGQSPKSEFYNETGNGLPFHQGVSDYGFRFPTHRVYCTAEGREAAAGDVLLSVRAPVGRINIADRKLILGRGVAGLRHANGQQSFLLYQMKHVFAEEDAVGDGTIYKAVNKDFLAGVRVITPAESVRARFETIARPMDEMIVSVENESAKLAALRDYLLPRLLSGRVRVREPAAARVAAPSAIA